jgi:Thioredoxin
MPVTREQFEAGLSYDAYKQQMTRNREQLETNERNLELKSDDLAAFKGLPKTLNVLALAEDWCGDVIANLPILGRIAADSGKLNVRVLLRDQEPGNTVMDQYLNQGQFRSIPVFVFLDEGFQDRGHWIERPASVTERREQLRRQLYASHPNWGPPERPISELPEDVRAEVQAATAQMRQEVAPWANQEVVRELRALAESAARPSVAA